MLCLQFELFYAAEGCVGGQGRHLRGAGRRGRGPAHGRRRHPPRRSEALVVCSRSCAERSRMAGRGSSESSRSPAAREVRWGCSLCRWARVTQSTAVTSASPAATSSRLLRCEPVNCRDPKKRVPLETGANAARNRFMPLLESGSLATPAAVAQVFQLLRGVAARTTMALAIDRISTPRCAIAGSGDDPQVLAEGLRHRVFAGLPEQQARVGPDLPMVQSPGQLPWHGADAQSPQALRQGSPESVVGPSQLRKIVHGQRRDPDRRHCPLPAAATQSASSGEKGCSAVMKGRRR